ncbi:MAG: hypothetical protein ABIQ57_18095, partial [Candidatus Kapaibacterium sp.]
MKSGIGVRDAIINNVIKGFQIHYITDTTGMSVKPRYDSLRMAFGSAGRGAFTFTEHELNTINCLKELFSHPGSRLRDALPMLVAAGFNGDSIKISDIDEDFPDSGPAIYPWISRSIVPGFRVRYFLLMLDELYNLAVVTEGENIVSATIRAGGYPFGIAPGADLLNIVADSGRLRLMND